MLTDSCPIIESATNKVSLGITKPCIFLISFINFSSSVVLPAVSNIITSCDICFAFSNADTVVLCPIYNAGEKIKLGFSYLNFAEEIIKNSKVKLFLIKNNQQLAKFLKNNIYGKKIVIGMGAGSISNWMRELPKLM